MHAQGVQSCIPMYLPAFRPAVSSNSRLSGFKRFQRFPAVIKLDEKTVL